jgi:hypothetical protein
LETIPTFGNSPQFPELPALLETIPSFGNRSPKNIAAGILSLNPQNMSKTVLKAHMNTET